MCSESINNDSIENEELEKQERIDSLLYRYEGELQALLADPMVPIDFKNSLKKKIGSINDES